ncbi:hypothetical protein AAG570_001144 [Ranatra chinensis]|uniref:Uncharacterized protein n=1 Tax=Ranatra chinensis TaxID=642074 RepID=A0ABD0YB10_9HEMI
MFSGYRKESVISDVTRTGDELPSIVAKLRGSSAFWSIHNNGLYPYSKVLRLRVLQIVCGISVLVMGAVACIEEKGNMTNLALGMPAGFVTVLAAGDKIDTQFRHKNHYVIIVIGIEAFMNKFRK